MLNACLTKYTTGVIAKSGRFSIADSIATDQAHLTLTVLETSLYIFCK